MTPIINPDFVPFTAEQYAALDAHMRTVVVLLLSYCEPPMLGDGNLEMMTEDLLWRALKHHLENGTIITIDGGHTFELKEQQS